MEYISFVEIENFKGFHEKVRINLQSPSVLIGPNNAGKTTIIQALSLWSRAINAWYEKKGQNKKRLTDSERFGVGINRLSIMDIPVKETRYYWNGSRIRKGNTPIQFSINVGVIDVTGKEVPFKMIFNSRDQESIYCRPDESILTNSSDETLLPNPNDTLIVRAKNLIFNLLYPMSGIAGGASQATEEYKINDGQMRVLMGQGQTASVLRNLCYNVFITQESDWTELCGFVKKLFQVELQNPVYDENRGALSLSYKQEGVEMSLDIALSGRGMQQILLILSYLYSHKGSVLMIDEPDAHLEILRQKQMFTILKDVAEKTKCQVIIATHSEVILEEAVDTNLTFLINGESIELNKSKMKDALKNLGIEHYCKAKVCPRILITEGSTDIDMLRAFALKINHPASEILTDKINTYYTQNIYPEKSLSCELERTSCSFKDYRNYYHTLKDFVPELKAVCIFDSDGKDRSGMTDPNLGVYFWDRYELENYFITPDSLIRYVDSKVNDGTLFSAAHQETIRRIVDEELATLLFKGDVTKVNEYKNVSPSIKEQLLGREKMSVFAEKVFSRYASEQKSPILLNKGEFYKIIDILSPSEIPLEITEKLDIITRYLSS